MTRENLNRILANHAVPSRDRAAMARFVLGKKKPTRPVLQRLLGYGAAIKAILSALSEEYFRERGIRFPPPDYRPVSRSAA
jgi:hypothetical protein